MIGARGPRQEAGLFLGATYGIALAISLALPHAEIAALLTIAAPITAVAATIVLTTPRGRRAAVWRTVGLGRIGARGLVVAVMVPAVVVGLSFGVAAALGVVDFPAPGPGAAGPLANLALVTTVFGVIFMGEEIGWRGYLLPRLADVVPARAATVATGACHAVFHLPLLLLTTTYQHDGNRWIVVPMVMVTLTLAGVFYGWLRLWSGSVWTVSLSHSAFNMMMGTAGAAAVATSPASMAYVTTETGVATWVIVLGLAGFLLVRRAADFERPFTTAAGRPRDTASDRLPAGTR